MNKEPPSLFRILTGIGAVIIFFADLVTIGTFVASLLSNSVTVPLDTTVANVLFILLLFTLAIVLLRYSR